MLPLASLFSMFSSDVVVFACLAVGAAIGLVALWNNRTAVIAKAQNLLPQASESLVQTGMRDLQTAQRDAMELSQILADEGLPLTSGLLKDVATGDLSTGAQHLRSIVDTLRDPVQRRLVFLAFLHKQVSRAAAQPAMKSQLLTMLEQALGQPVTVGDPPDAKVS